MILRPLSELKASSNVFVNDQKKTTQSIKYDVFELDEQFTHYELTKKPATLKLNTGEDYRSEEKQLVSLHTKLKVFLLPFPKTEFVLAKEGAVQFKTAAVVKFTYKNGTYQLAAFSNGAPLYWNKQRCQTVFSEFKVGAKLYVDGLLLERRTHQLKVIPLRDDVKVDITHFLPQADAREFPVTFPEFRRSPRIYLREPTEKVSLKSRPTLQALPRSAVLQLLIPPLGMIGVSGLMSYLSGGNAWMMFGLGSVSLLTAGFSAASYFTSKKEIAKKNQATKKAYQKYLLALTGRLATLKQQQQEVLAYHYPKPQKIVQMMLEYDPRLYERMITDEDFLTVSLGTGTLPSSYTFEYPKNEAQAKSELEEFIAQKIITPHLKVENVPLTVPLQTETVGLAGNRQALRQALQTLLFQLAAFHSYHDVQFIALLSEAEYQKYWHEWRWAPHFQLAGLNLRGLVHDLRSRELVLNSLYQVLASRKKEVAEKKTLRFKPQLVLVIEEEAWLNGHNLNEFLLDDLSKYGVSVIWVKEHLTMLPETVTTLIEYHSPKLGTLLTKERKYQGLTFKPAPYPKGLLPALKRLANLRHIEIEKNMLPEQISLLELYQVTTVADLALSHRWQEADTASSLAVPLGVRGKDEPLFLNLHERAHGPHGLLAGTTGSGKSEVLQSLILSLAINFAPADVGFLPIDYKGGGMADLFAKLPHLLGTITNLDGASTARALKSIHAELERRQRLFRQFGVNHINGYTKLYKAGQKKQLKKRTYPTEPLPHLFLISDEFAELKANEPEFMDELVSTARIGRSLGVHLILATQKPSGVVNDQIWSNSRFKIALKVADPADSKEILHTPDAATLTLPGRAYLQVGNNEIYELFQSAYSGAKYQPKRKKDAQTKVDERIWSINQLGQAELLTADLSLETERMPEEVQTELEAIISQIATEVQATHQVLPKKPWLPPLEKVLTNTMSAWQAEWQTKKQLAVPLGKLDLPTKQAQTELIFDVEQFLPAVIVGSSGYGKSTALQTLVMNLAQKNSPAQIHFYLFDLGTNGLLPLQGLPHTADLVKLTEPEKFFKLLRILERKLALRKEKFQALGIADQKQYQAVAGEELTTLLLIVDAYDNILESAEREVIERFFEKIVREGQALGIDVIFSATRFNSLRMSLSTNLNKRLSLYLVDNDEYKSLQGRDAPVQLPFAGRGQIKLDSEVLEFQTYLPTKATDGLATVKELKALSQAMERVWTGARPEKVPLLPKEVTLNYFWDHPSVKEFLEKGGLPLVLDKETTNAVGFLPDKMQYFVILTETLAQTEALEKTLQLSLSHLRGKHVKYIIDLNGERTGEGFDELIGPEQVGHFFTELEALIKTRTKAQQPTTKYYIYWPEFVEKINTLELSEARLKKILYQGSKLGIHFIFQEDQTKLLTAFDPRAKLIKNGFFAGILGTRIIEQSFLKVKGSFKETALAYDECNFIVGQQVKRSKFITKWE